MTKKMIDNEELNSRHGQYNLNKDWLICYTDRDIDEMEHLVKEILCDTIIDRTKDYLKALQKVWKVPNNNFNNRKREAIERCINVATVKVEYTETGHVR